MKRLTLISIFIFWAIIVSVLAAGMIVGNKSSVLTASSPAVLGGTVLTIDEVAKDNSVSDCWSIIDNKVYNLTDFLNIHSGGVGAILPYCGKDGTNAFNTKDSNPAKSHRQGDLSILQNYYVGDLGQSINAVTTATSSQNVRQNQAFPSVNNTGGNITLTAAEVAKHNSRTDCWSIISGKVYNVTSFLPSHPGGVAAILPFCGKDATQAFNVSVPHSQNAHNILASYYVGDLNQSVSSQSVQSSSNPVTTPSFRGEGDD